MRRIIEEVLYYMAMGGGATLAATFAASLLAVIWRALLGRS